MLRAHGRFLDDYRQAPLRIVNHLSRQLDLPPVLLLDRPRRDPTGRVQAQRIRRYLGIRSFDRAAEADLRDWIRQGAVEGRSVIELLRRAEDRLRAWQVMVPRASTLARIVASEGARATTELFTIVAQRLSASLRDAISLLLEVPEGDARSSLFRLKDHAKSAKAATIKGDLGRLGLIDELLAGGTGLDDIDPRILRQLGELGRRYDAGDLRRFARSKRDALVACHLVEARKSLLDRVVELHDQFMTTMSRRARLAADAQLRAALALAK
jgi:hypothetical protein